VAAFSELGNPLDIFIPKYVNEIISAYNERATFISGATTPYAARVVGDDAHGQGFWAGLQYAVELLAPTYVNHTLFPGVGGYEGESPTIEKFTIATWRETAGLNADGFRRTTVWPVLEWEYGLAQVGDVFGPWIYEDLRAGLLALQWTNPTASLNTKYKVGIGEDGTCDDAAAAQAADWPADWSTPENGGLGYRVQASISHGVLIWKVEGRRYAGRTFSVFGTSGTVLDFDVDVYWVLNSYSSPQIDYTFTSNTLFYYETLSKTGEAAGSAIYTSWLGEIDSNPVGDFGLACPTTEAKSNITNTSYGARWIAKWQFSIDA
jgi:hypothetical protein